MRYLTIVFLIFFYHIAATQPLRDINYNYLYNPDEPVSLSLNPIRLNDNWKVFFNLSLKDTANVENYQIQWEEREALNSKDGKIVFLSEGHLLNKSNNDHWGFINVPLSDKQKILVGKVVDKSLKRAWNYYVILENNYPITNYIRTGETPVIQKFIKTNQAIGLNTDFPNGVVSFYNDVFPPAAPAFSETQGRVSKGMKPDSVYSITKNTDFTFPQKGLYLLQNDTLAAEGFCIRAEEDYPRYSKVQNLAGPLIYICSKQEYDRLEAAKGDKKIFDRTVLGITADEERAKKLIRNYFRRVELANLYFTSYKEGWKTDRGMIYIIFGLPNQVYKFYDREVWRYDNSSFDITFNFSKASSIFDPDNYVLIRDKKYQDTWYEVVDLWRNARF